MQNELFVAVFKNYIAKHKNVFYDLSVEKQISDSHALNLTIIGDQEVICIL